jgi:hypothetical protein
LERVNLGFEIEGAGVERVTAAADDGGVGASESDVRKFEQRAVDFEVGAGRVEAKRGETEELGEQAEEFDFAERGAVEGGAAFAVITVGIGTGALRGKGERNADVGFFGEEAIGRGRGRVFAAGGVRFEDTDGAAEAGVF